MLDKNRIIENKLNNNKNKTTINEIQTYNTYDKKKLFHKLSCKNNISSQGKNHKCYFLQKYSTHNNIKLKINNEKNNLINNKIYKTEYFLNDNNISNNILKNKKFDKNTITNRKNNYLKNIYDNYIHYSDMKKDYYRSILSHSYSIKYNNNSKNLNLKMNLVGKDTVRNIGQRKITENNNIYNNLNNNYVLAFKNMEVSEQKLFENALFDGF